MPVFTPTIGQQNIASSGGVRAYPDISGQVQYAKFIDDFNRDSVTPSGAFTLYSTGNNQGTGGATIVNGVNCQVATTGTLNDDTDFWTSGQALDRTMYLLSSVLDNRTLLDVYVTFAL